MGQTFTTDANNGFLVVAYPNEDDNYGQFAFEYYTDAVLKPEPGSEPEPETTEEVSVVLKEEEKPAPEPKKEEAMDDMMFIILCGVAGFILICIIGLCTYWKCKNRKMAVVGDVVSEKPSDTSKFGGPPSNVELKLEDFDEHVAAGDS